MVALLRSEREEGYMLLVKHEANLPTYSRVVVRENEQSGVGRVWVSAIIGISELLFATGEG